MTTEETNRREFEKWVETIGYSNAQFRDSDEYISDAVKVAWGSWQAARERDKRIIEVLKDGLQTDGAHHKQWYLNEVMKLINADIAKDVETHWTHDGGIAP